jgi:hypothetical protein
LHRCAAMRSRLFMILVWAAVVSGCEEGPPSRTSARDRATAAACSHYQRCGNIGPGDRYTSRDGCDVELRATFERLWPAASCEERISETQLALCLSSIDTAECNDGLDFLRVLDKCQAAKVCPQ